MKLVRELLLGLFFGLIIMAYSDIIYRAGKSDGRAECKAEGVRK